MSVITLNDHITFNTDGFPIVKGTTTKVVEIVMDVKAHGWSPEEIHYQHPYLSMAQIHSALAYYWDNREDIERDIDRRTALVEELLETLKPYSIRPILKERGAI